MRPQGPTGRLVKKKKGGGVCSTVGLFAPKASADSGETRGWVFNGLQVKCLGPNEVGGQVIQSHIKSGFQVEATFSG